MVEEARSGSNYCQRRVEGQRCLKIVCDGKLFPVPLTVYMLGRIWQVVNVPLATR